MKKLACSFFILIFFIFMIACTNENKTTKEDIANSPKESVEDTSTKEVKNILFFGNSLTAGYGLELSQAFPALIQAKIDSLNLPYKVINAGLSGETTESGNTRIDWMLNQKIDVLVLELGGNDGLRGISPELTKKNLQSIIEKTKNKYPDVKIVLAGMEAPPNMGEKFTSDFRKLYKELAEANQIAFIPFLLEGVGGDPKLNLPDGIHPTPEGHKIVAETVWKVLKEVL
ncbi:acyl-CoA thioesterase-1 [Thermoflexibacter ruber]|uniref:Acyl-CoA thioesterase-1 n=2 Tax=Thermoflexibacter ruber TaxID=1003 RepID=A0A1I2JBK7_9BACT|nr:acyl-CoA thioesterase-1 [Thermoflexibacter ruber]